MGAQAVIADTCQPLVESGLLAVFNIYIKEAHATNTQDALVSNTDCGIVQNQPTTLAERLAAAKNFQAALEGTPAEGWPILVDDITNALDEAFEALPERLVVVDHNLKVVYCSGQGPFQYNKADFCDWITEIGVDEGAGPGGLALKAAI